MEKLREFIAFVKDQVAFHQTKADHFERRALKFPAEGHRAVAHRKMLGRFTELEAFLESLQAMPAGSGQSRPVLSKLGLSPEELEGLPPELLEELNITEADRADFAVLSVLDEAGGVLSLDKLLIGLYRKTGEVHKRTQLNSRLYRMMQKGSVFSVPGKKGVYSTHQMSDEEADEIV